MYIYRYLSVSIAKRNRIVLPVREPIDIAVSLSLSLIRSFDRPKQLHNTQTRS